LRDYFKWVKNRFLGNSQVEERTLAHCDITMAIREKNDRSAKANWKLQFPERPNAAMSRAAKLNIQRQLRSLLWGFYQNFFHGSIKYLKN